MTPGRKAPRRLLHTSDIHLELLGDKACASLEALVNVRLDTRADLVLIAGDLFDSSKVDDSLVSFAAAQLRHLEVPVVVLPGNHDCLVPESAYNRPEIWNDCPNVRLLKSAEGETLDLDDLGIRLWGKAICGYEGDIRPMAGIPRPEPNGRWHVAVAHGFCISERPTVYSSYQISEEEIASSGWDYVALGHVVLFRCVCDRPVKAYYSGSPAFSGGVAVVDLDEKSGVRVTRHPLRATA